MLNNHYLKLFLVTHIAEKSIQQYQKFLETAAAGGITAVQFREKNKTYSELKNLALEIQAILKPFKIPLIINDHVDLAKEINADGVHLGQSDMSPQKARDLLGQDKIIGLSIESLAELTAANQLNCINYLAASAIFPSKTKTNCKKFWGLDGLNQIIQIAKHPVIAIGGIDMTNVTEIVKLGAAGVAIVSAIHDHSNPKKISTLLINRINQQIAVRDQYV